jgi:trk system potassium uptake protein TrkA
MARRKAAQDVAVIGLGRFGASVALRLEGVGIPVLGIDLDPEKVKDIADEVTQALVLDATDDEALDQADIGSFRTVVVAMANSFEASVLATLHLKASGVSEIVAQAASPIHRDALLRLGATQVVIPEEDSGGRLAEVLAGTAEIERLRLGGGRSLAGLPVPERFVGETVEACERSGVTFVMLRRGEEMILTPSPDLTIVRGDVVYAMGDESSLSQFSRKA